MWEKNETDWKMKKTDSVQSKIEMENSVINTVIAEAPSWKNEADRFIQFQENLNINFTIKEEWR